MKFRIIITAVILIIILGLQFSSFALEFETYKPSNLKRDSKLIEYLNKCSYPYNEEDFFSYKKYAEVHPRLFTDIEKVNYIRSEKDGIYKEIYESYINKGESLLNTRILDWNNTTGTALEFRPVANNLQVLASIYLLTGDERYYYGTVEGCYGILPGVLKVCKDYKHWGINNNDLLSAQMTFAMALIYDYCYDIMKNDVKNLILDTVRIRGGCIYNYCAENRNKVNLSNNHIFIRHSGIGAFALASFEDFNEAETWLKESLNLFCMAWAVTPDDGSFQEGFGYSQYGMAYMNDFAELSKKFFNINLYNFTDYFKNYPKWLLHNRGFDRTSNKSYIFDYGDNDYNGDWNDIVKSLYYSASEYDSGFAQYLGNELASSTTLEHNRIWAYNPNIVPSADYRLTEPSTWHFNDLDFVFTRDKWSDNSPMLLFMCGPPQGHKQTSMDVSGARMASGHQHPDENHFSLYGYDWEKIFRDDYQAWGYYSKRTDHHNTLLVNGMGQLGESNARNTYWMQPLQFMPSASKPFGYQPHMEKVIDEGDFVYAVGNATEAYPLSLGLKKFKRHFIYIRPNTLIILDDIETDKKANLNIRFLPEIQNLIKTDTGFIIPGIKNRTDIFSLTPEGVDITADTEDLLINDVTKATINKLVLNYKKETSKWVNAVAISWERNNADKLPPQVTMKNNGDIYTFNIGRKSYQVDISNNSVKPLENKSKYILEIDSEKITSSNNPCLIINDTAYANYESFTQALGYKLNWNSKNGILDIQGKDKSIKVDFINEEITYKSGTEIFENDKGKKPIIYNNLLLLPIRDIAEFSDYSVRWNENESMIQLYNNENEYIKSSKVLGIYNANKLIEGFSPDKYEYDVTRDLTGGQLLIMPQSPAATYKTLEKENKVEITVTNNITNIKSTYNINLFYPTGFGNVPIKNIVTNVPEVKSNPWVMFSKNVKDYWASESLDTEFVCEFEKPCIIDRVGIKFHMGFRRIYYFKLQVSIDGEIWKTVYDGTSNPTGEEDNNVFTSNNDMEHFNFDPVNAKYLKYISDGNNEGSYCSILELGIFKKGVE